MLQLRPRNRDLYSFVPSDEQYVDRNNTTIRLIEDNDNDHYETAILNRYCSTKTISYATLPYKIRGINVTFQAINYYVKPEIESTKQNTAEQIIRNFTSVMQLAQEEEHNSVLVQFLYVRHKTVAEDIVSKMSGSVIGNMTEKIDDTYDALYQKTLMDTVSRYGYTYANDVEPYVAVWKNTNGLIIATNWSDDDQASLHYLTIGLLPVLFPQFKDLFEEQEMNYFKELVHRSQVKRINNSVVADLFHNMCESCYKDMTLTLLKNRLGQEIKQARIRTAKQDFVNATNQAEQYLMNYNNQLKKIEEANKTLLYIEQTESEIAEQITAALKAPYIVDLRYEDYNQVLYMTMVGALKFWEEDEAELCIDRMPTNSLPEQKAKQFFTDVFIDKKYKLLVEQQFWICFSSDANINIDNWIPRGNNTNVAFINPHLYFYGCTGDYKPQLIKAARELDLMTYNSICYTSLISINFKDGAVWSRFKENIIALMQDILYGSYNLNSAFRHMKCLEDKEGNKYSIEQIYKQTEAEDIEVEDL